MNLRRLDASVVAGLGSALLILLSAPARADHPPLHVDPSVRDCSIRFAPELTQGAFRRFVREFGSVSAFKLAFGPAPLGRHRVAVELEQMNFSLDEHADAWNDTFVHPDGEHELGSELGVPKLHLRVGADERLDAGVFYTRNFQANYGWLGADVRYAAVRPAPATPFAVAARAAYTRTLHVSDMSMHAFTGELEVGRECWGVVTPYIGAGADLVTASETSDAVRLERETHLIPHALAGIEYRARHVAIGVEASRTALTSVQLHVAAIF